MKTDEVPQAFVEGVTELHQIVREIFAAALPVHSAHGTHPQQVAIALWCCTQLVLGEFEDDAMMAPALKMLGQAYVDTMQSLDGKLPTEKTLVLRVVQLMMTRAKKPGLEIVNDALSGDRSNT